MYVSFRLCRKVTFSYDPPPADPGRPDGGRGATTKELEIPPFSRSCTRTPPRASEEYKNGRSGSKAIVSRGSMDCVSKEAVRVAMPCGFSLPQRHAD